MHRFPHAIEYLIYAYLQKGADDEAAVQLKRLRATARLEPTFKTAFHLVLAVLGAKSDEVRPTSDGVSRVFRERHELLLAWLPNVEPFVLPNATHLLHLQNPRGMAEGLAAFFARHPLSAR